MVVVILLVLFISVNFVSAGLLDWFKYIFGGQDRELDLSPTGNSSVVGRFIFYSGSSFDGNDPGINANDDNSIATDKTALLPGQTAETKLTEINNTNNITTTITPFFI